MPHSVKKYLELSTAHMPGPDSPFEPLRSSPTQHGFVVWPQADIDTNLLPIWLFPVHELANRQGCSMIEFDGDNPTNSLLSIYSW